MPGLHPESSKEDAIVSALTVIAEKLDAIHSVLSETTKYTYSKKLTAEERDRRQKAFADWILKYPPEAINLYYQSDEYREATDVSQQQP